MGEEKEKNYDQRHQLLQAHREQEGTEIAVFGEKNCVYHDNDNNNNDNTKEKEIEKQKQNGEKKIKKEIKEQQKDKEKKEDLTQQDEEAISRLVDLGGGELEREQVL